MRFLFALAFLIPVTASSTRKPGGCHERDACWYMGGRHADGGGWRPGPYQLL